jgi:WD40 repeat protein
LALSPDLKTLVAGTPDGLINVFDLNTQELKCEFQGPNTAIKAITFSPCGKYFATGGGKDAPKIVIWKLKDHSIESIYEKDTGSEISELFWSDGLLVSTHGDGNLRLFNINPAKKTVLSDPVLRKADNHRIPFAAYSDQTLIMGCPGDGIDRETIKIWKIQPFQKTGTKRKREPSSTFSNLETLR